MCLDQVVGGQTSEVTSAITNFVLRGGESLKEELLASTVPSSFHFLFLTTKRDVEIARQRDHNPPIRRKVNKKFSNCILVLAHVRKESEGHMVEVNMWDKRNNSSLFLKTGVTTDEGWKPLANMILMLASQPSVRIIAVTICPESLTFLEEMWSLNTEEAFKNIFHGWTCLAAEAYCLTELSHPDSLLFAIPMEANRAGRLLRYLRNVMEDKKKRGKGQGNESDTTVLRLIHTKVLYQHEDKLAKQSDVGNVAAVKEGRALKVEGNLMPLLVEVRVDVQEGENLPRLSNVTFSDSSGRVGSCSPREFILQLLELWPDLGQVIVVAVEVVVVVVVIEEVVVVVLELVA